MCAQPADSFDEGRCKALADEWTACTQAVRKLHAHLRAAKEAAVEHTLPQLRAPASMQPHAVDMDQELDDAARVRASGHHSVIILINFHPIAENSAQYRIKEVQSTLESDASFFCCLWREGSPLWLAVGSSCEHTS